MITTSGSKTGVATISVISSMGITRTSTSSSGLCASAAMSAGMAATISSRGARNPDFGGAAARRISLTRRKIGSPMSIAANLRHKRIDIMSRLLVGWADGVILAEAGASSKRAESRAFAGLAYCAIEKSTANGSLRQTRDDLPLHQDENNEDRQGAEE